MGAPNSPRVRRVKANTVPKHNPQAALWKNPATRPKAVGAGRPAGVADGYTKKQTEVLRAKAEADADRIIENMNDEDLKTIQAVVDAEGLVDDEKAAARTALKTVITLVLMPGNAKDKLAAARTVLEWTKQKPAAKQDMTLSGAEDFLGALLVKDKTNG